jgi:ketosteroid isomerase-like protein
METQPTTGAADVLENTNLVRETYDCFFRGDIEGLMEKYTDDVHWEVYGPSSLPTAGPRHGKQELTAYFGQVAELLQSNKFDVQEYIAQGDKVVTLGEYNWTSKATGKEFEAHFVHAVTVRNGKICKFREYTDTHAAVAAMT